MALSDFLGLAAQNLRASIEVRSNVTPPVTIADPLGTAAAYADAPPSPPSFLLRLIAPSITIDSALGRFTVEPYGAPGEGTWIAALAIGSVAGIGLLALAGYGAYRLLR